MDRKATYHNTITAQPVLQSVLFHVFLTACLLVAGIAHCQPKLPPPDQWTAPGGKKITGLYGTETIVFTEHGKATPFDSDDDVTEGDCTRTLQATFNGDEVTVEVTVSGKYTRKMKRLDGSTDPPTPYIFTITHNLSGNASKKVTQSHDLWAIMRENNVMFVNANLGIARFNILSFSNLAFHVDVTEDGLNAHPAHSFDVGGTGIILSQSPSIISPWIVLSPGRGECKTPFSDAVNALEQQGHPYYDRWVEAPFNGTSTQGVYSADVYGETSKQRYIVNHPKDLAGATKEMSHFLPGTIKVSWNLSIKPINIAKNNPPKGNSGNGNPGQTPTSETDFSVRDVPAIMRNIATKTGNAGWNKAGEFLDHWFESKAQIDPAIDGKYLKSPDWDLPVYHNVTMDWILDPKNSVDVDGSQSSRVQEGYKDLIKRLTNDAALKVLLGHIESSEPFLKGATVVHFPFFLNESDTFVKDEKTHLEQIQRSDVHAGTFAHPHIYLDPVEAVCGNFSFYAIPHGFAVKGSNGIKITIDKFFIYEVSSYHFTTDKPPYLGSWKNPDGLKADIFDAELNTTPSGYTRVDNKSYRTYRQKNGVGGDFLCISNIKIYDLPQPFVK